MDDRRSVGVMAYVFNAPLWLWSGKEAWHFLTVPTDLSDDIDEATTGLRRGFGSVPVEVTVGATTWTTSIFPSKTESAYILPVKKAVRDAEGLTLDARVEVRLALVHAPD